LDSQFKEELHKHSDMYVYRAFASLLSICIAFQLLQPTIIYAQSQPLDPGRDVFELTPEKLRLFGGAEGNSELNSLFNGDEMKNNGLFSPSTRQLGGASPDLTAPIRQTEEPDMSGPTFVQITSQYSPSGDLTKDSEITLTVKLKNIGLNVAENITFKAMLQDDYIVMLDDPAPVPPTSEVIENDPGADNGGENNTPPIPTLGNSMVDPTVNNPVLTLVWNRDSTNQPITLDPNEEITFKWSFQPTKDDVVIRWRFVAEFGAGQSVLRQWIPVKNPNPVGIISGGGSNAGGIPSSCTSSTGSQSSPFPEGSSMDQIISAMESRWKFKFLDGSYSWRQTQYKPVVKIWWDTLSAVECTPFLTEINKKNGGGLNIYAHDIGSLWGTYGLHFPGALAINIQNHLGAVNNGIPEKVTQNIIHELGHAYNNDRGSNPAYWVEHNNIYNSAGPISAYGASEITENVADVFGYYVARCSGESFQASGPNPYANGNTEFYNFAKTMIFGNVEFGPPAPSEVSC
jgi:hypothetical protein